MITKERLVELLFYNENNGLFVWKVDRGSNKTKGRLAGNVTVSRAVPYIMISVDGYPYLAHRLAWLYVHGEFPENEIDHINGNGLDNKISNLRPVTHKENARNGRHRKNNTSGVCGVCWHKKAKKWMAQIKDSAISGHKNLYLGLYKDKFDAICARKSAENKLNFHPNHGRTENLWEQ